MGGGSTGGSSGSSRNAGMFGGTGGSTYSPTLNPGQWGQAQYDFSGIQQGARRLNDLPSLRIGNYNPFQFHTGEYGTTDPQMMGDIYSQAYNLGAKPIMAQGAEAMRQSAQGFGAGGIGNAAQRTQQLRQSQATGSQLQNLGGTIGNNLANQRLQELQTARSAMFNANQANQMNQSNANFQAAGFNADAARSMSQDAVNRATAMMGYGFQLPQLQLSLNQAGMSPYMGLMDQAQKMALGTVQPGTNLQSSGKKG